MSTVKRVIKNTGYLYMKMFITVFISLYTTRLILNSLGAADFGIFNIIGGAIGMLGFLNTTMANATQRFMSYAEGEGCLEQKKRAFNVSLILHIIIAIFTVILLFLIMPILFDSILNIESERIFAAKIVYYSLMFSTALTIINVPYDAVMNAHENMLYYSLIGVFEWLLKLIVAFICVYTSHDKLIVYGTFMAFIPIVTLSIMKIYCHKHYEECVIAFKRYWDCNLVRQIASFSGWNFLTAISSLFSAQGIGIVLNHFFGTVLNAAQGVAQQLNGQLSSFAFNMMKALNPIIVKNAGAKNIDKMNEITIIGCKYASFLVLLFAIPFILEMPFILLIWLKEIPDWACLFCILQIILTIILQVVNGLGTSIYAQGDIKGYAIYKSLMNAMPVILTFIAFKMGGSPYWLYIPMIVIWGIGGDIVILYYAKKKCGLDLKQYLIKALLPILGVSFVMILFGGIVYIWNMNEGFCRFVLTCIMTSIGMLLALFLFGVNGEEKALLRNLLMRLKSC